MSWLSCLDHVYLKSEWSGWYAFFGITSNRRTIADWKRMADEYVSRFGHLPTSAYLQANHLQGLDNAIRNHPEIFGVRTSQIKKPSEWVPIAERLSKKHGAVPAANDLKRLGLSGLHQCMNSHPHLFSHLSRNSLRKTTKELVKIAETIAQEHGGLPGHRWLIDNGYGALYGALRAKPLSFSHIPRNVKQQKTIDDYVKWAEKIAQEHNGILRSKHLKNASPSLVRVFQKFPDAFKHIPQYAPRMNLDYITQYASRMGIGVISKKYRSYHRQMKFQCGTCGAQWKTTPSSFVKCTFGCKKCAKKSCAAKQRFSIDDVQKIAKERNVIFLSKSYETIGTRYKWKCKKCSREWMSSLANVKGGGGCRICSLKKSWDRRGRTTIEELQSHAQKRGGKCLSKKYVGCEQKYKWKCKSGHTWESAWRSLKHQNSWCRMCRKPA